MARTPFFPRRPRTVMAAVQPALQSGSARTPTRAPIARVAWQSEALRFAATIPIVSYAGLLTENLVSRLGWEILRDGKALDQSTNMLEYVNGPGGFEALAGRAAWFMLITGECWLAVLDGPEWVVVSSDAITFNVSQGTATIRRRQGNQADGITVPLRRVQRLWAPDHSFDQDAWSPVRAILQECERYERLGQNMSRVAESRLLQNGMWWSPSEAHIPANEDGRQADESPLIRGYYDAARKAFDGTGNVAAAAPFPIWWPHEYGPPTKIDFGVATEDAVVAQREEAKQAIAQGLPIPSLILLDGPGSGGNHWGDLLADEQTFSQGLAPIADRVADDLTTALLRPLLTALGTPDPERYAVSYSAAPILNPPDSRADALRLHELGIVSDQFVLDAFNVDEGSLQPAPVVMPGNAMQVEAPKELRNMIPDRPAMLASLVPNLFEVR